MRIVLTDVPHPSGNGHDPLFKRGDVVFDENASIVPGGHLSPKLPKGTYYLITQFDIHRFSVIQCGEPGTEHDAGVFPRCDLDVYGQELGDERRDAIVLRREERLFREV